MAGLSGLAALALLLPMEAGVPIPLPALTELTGTAPVGAKPVDEPKPVAG